MSWKCLRSSSFGVPLSTTSNRGGLFTIWGSRERDAQGYHPGWRRLGIITLVVIYYHSYNPAQKLWRARENRARGSGSHGIEPWSTTDGQSLETATVQTAVPNAPSKFDFNGMPAAQFKSNGLPQTTVEKTLA